MLDISERMKIFEMYVKREEDKKRAPTHKDIKNLINNETCDIKDKEKIIQSISFCTSEWIELLFKGGYATPYFLPKELHLSRYLAERKKNLSKRYKIWNRLRPYLNQISTEKPLWFPTYHHTLFQFVDYKNSKEMAHDVNLFLQMIINYIPLHEIYQFDPIYGKGYMWYTGEPLILYYLTEELYKNRMKFSRFKRCVMETKVNGYDLKNVYKVIICLFDWKALDDQRGISPFKHFILSNKIGDIRQQCMLYWKDYCGSKAIMNEFNLVEYAANERILPWPYKVKDKKLVLLDETVEKTPITSEDQQ